MMKDMKMNLVNKRLETLYEKSKDRENKPSGKKSSSKNTLELIESMILLYIIGKEAAPEYVKRNSKDPRNIDAEEIDDVK